MKDSIIVEAPVAQLVERLPRKIKKVVGHEFESRLGLVMGMKKYPEISVGGIIFNEEREILLVKSWKWHNNYTMPGGHVEVGESMEDALKREVKEEVGIDVSNIEFINIQEAIFSKEFFKPKHFIFIDFTCRARSSDVKVDEKELQEFIWTKPENALKLNVDSFTKKSIKKYLELKGVREWK